MQTFLRWGLGIVFLGLLYGAGGFGAPMHFYPWTALTGCLLVYAWKANRPDTFALIFFAYLMFFSLDSGFLSHDAVKSISAGRHCGGIFDRVLAGWSWVVPPRLWCCASSISRRRFYRELPRAVCGAAARPHHRVAGHLVEQWLRRPSNGPGDSKPQ